MGGVRNQSGLVNCPNCKNETTFFLVSPFQCVWCGYNIRGQGSAWYGYGEDPAAEMNVVQAAGPDVSLRREFDPNGRASKEPGSKLDGGKLPIWRGVLGYFPRALAAVAEVSGKGAVKYTWSGWRTVPDGFHRYSDALSRHLIEEAKGEVYDSDTDSLHAAHAAWNALARLELLLDAKAVPVDAPTPYEQANAVHAEDQLFDSVVVDACARAGAMKLGH